MKPAELFAAKKETIAKQWFKTAIDDYAPDAAAFYKNAGDDFANPVGSTTRKSLARLLEAILDGSDDDSIAAIIDPLVRIRAVQAFKPSQATAFVFALKPILRSILATEEPAFGQWIPYEDRIDRAALIGFDVFMQCREKIYEIRTNEERNKTYKAFARAGLIKDVRPDEPNLKFI